MMGQYILDGHKAVPATDPIAWGRWREKADCVVARDRRGRVTVSTAFLGRDHSFGEGEPLLFETMVLGGPHHGEQDRYSTWEQAEAGHAAMCARVGVKVAR